MATLLNTIKNDLKKLYPNAFIDELPNYTGDPNNCKQCKDNVEELDYLFIFDPENDGVDPTIFCDSICFVKFNMN